MHPLIEDNLEAIRSISREFEVVRLEVFGSICTSEFDPDHSDIDFLVEFPPNYDFGPWHAKYHEMRRALSAQVSHPVDLVDVRALRDPWLLREAAKTRRVVCDAPSVRQTA